MNDTQDISEWFSKFERLSQEWNNKERADDVAKWFEDAALRNWEYMNFNDKESYLAIKNNLI